MTTTNDQPIFCPDGSTRFTNQDARDEARRERLASAVVRHTADAEQAFTRARQLADVVPFGQPILVGHHSEGRHRSLLKRVDGLYRSGSDSFDRAKSLSSRTVGNQISSADGDAIGKLQREVERLELSVAEHKADLAIAKKAFRAWCKETGRDPKFVEGGDLLENCSDRTILSMVDLGLARHTPFMRVRWLGSMAPKLNATRKRLAELEAFHETEPLVGDGPGWSLCEDDGRWCLVLDCRNDPEMKARVRSAGFVWSPSRSCWVRKLTPQARRAVESFMSTLPNLAAQP